MEQIIPLEQQGKAWLKGHITVEKFGEINMNPKQATFFNAKERYNLASGGRASGKTTAFTMKSLMLSQWFPGSRTLIGRKTKTNASETFMKDFRKICPPEIYEYKVGEGKIVYRNGSEATFFGLDALQSDGEDTKKAEQTLKSHNFHFVFIDQLEEIEQRVFDAVDATVRARMCPHDINLSRKYRKKGHTIWEECTVCGLATFNQFNMTTNPANYWGYEFFKGNPNPQSHLVETSLLDNKDFLPESFVQAQLSKPKKWVDRYVIGKWEPWGEDEALVFLSDYLHQQRAYQIAPLREFNGISIFAEPKDSIYQIGVDPSEGSQDPSAIVVFDTLNGEVAATFRGFVNAQTIAERAVQLALLYNRVRDPLIIPEANGVGAAVVEHLKPRYANIYIREQYNSRENKETKKLGWNTNVSTKRLLIEHGKTLFDRGFLKLRDKRIIDEFLVFQYTSSAKREGAGAKDGFHDDMVMATLLSAYDVQPVTPTEKTLFDRIKKREEKYAFEYE